MKILKKLVHIILYLFLLVVLVPSIFAACLDEPSFVKVTSGSVNVGEFEINDEIYIKSNLLSDPLKIEYVFDNNEQNCFVGQNDMKMKLFSSGAEIFANSISTTNIQGGTFRSTFTFIFQLDFNVTSPFTSTFLVKSNGNSQNIGSLSFEVDNSAPIINIKSINPSDLIVKKGEEISVSYEVIENDVGLQTIIESSKTSDVINFDNSQNSFDNVITEILDSNQKVVIKAIDKLSQESSKEVNFIVDGNGPIARNLVESYTFDSSQKVSYTVIIEDSSFGLIDEEPNVVGDFSEINPSFQSYIGDCTRNSNTTFICSFSDIPIDVDSTKNVNIKINAQDSLGNEKETSISKEIFVDNEGPTILSFRVINSIGVENIFNPNDSNVTVELKLRDGSISRSGNPRVIENFGEIPLVNQQCEFEGETGTCTWELGESLRVYNNLNLNSTVFEVGIIDFYSNTKTESINNIKIDKKNPVLQEIILSERNSIKDGILTSGEETNFRIITSDENLFSNEFFIFGNFSNIDFRDGKDKVKGSCSSFNLSSHICDFNNIKVENGYLKRNISFSVSDSAGNEIIEKFEVEIFNISNEVVSSFKISDIQTTNPINRNQILDNSVTSWFEGKLELKGDPQMKIVNYQLVNCDSSGIDPLLAIDFSLFPDDVIINNGQNDVNEFALKVELKDHPNVNDLNQKKMECTMTVLKRDNVQVFQPEIINFELKFAFFDIPRGNLLEAHAEKLLDMIAQTEYLGGYFETIYEIYSLFSSVCGLISTGGGALSAASSVVTGVQTLMTEGSLGTLAAPADALGETYKAESTLMESVTGEDSPIKIMCDWVTCRNGAHITGLISSGLGFEDSDLGQSFNNLQNGWDALCSGDFETAGKTPQRLFN